MKFSLILSTIFALSYSRSHGSNAYQGTSPAHQEHSDDSHSPGGNPAQLPSAGSPCPDGKPKEAPSTSGSGKPAKVPPKAGAGTPGEVPSTAGTLPDSEQKYPEKAVEKNPHEQDATPVQGTSAEAANSPSETPCVKSPPVAGTAPSSESKEKSEDSPEKGTEADKVSKENAHAAEKEDTSPESKGKEEQAGSQPAVQGKAQYAQSGVKNQVAVGILTVLAVLLV